MKKGRRRHERKEGQMGGKEASEEEVKKGRGRHERKGGERGGNGRE